MRNPIISSALKRELLKQRERPNYNIVEELVFYVHKNLCNHELPIDLSFMYNFKNLKVKTYSWFANLNHISIEETIEKLNSNSGCCYYKPSTGQYLILYNDCIINPYHNRWTLAHELGHYLLKHNEICDTAIIGRNSIDFEEYKIYEKEANAFARGLLAPLNVLCCISDKVTVSQIMEICDLSYEAATNIINFANTGLQMGISYFCESRTTQIFKKFINNQKYLKFCCNCNYSFTSLNAKFCPICGHNRLIKGDSKNKMKYNCNYHLDANSRTTECPICHNEEISDGEYCKICGTYLINKCTNIEEDMWGNQIGGCGRLAEANARYCIFCGSETTFYKNKLLCDYTQYDAKQETLDFLWQEILLDMKKEGHVMLYTNLLGSSFSEIDEKTICISLNKVSSFTKAVLSKEMNIDLLKKNISNRYSKSIYVNIRDNSNNTYIYEDMVLPF